MTQRGGKSKKPDSMRLRSLAESQAGYFTATQARECGLSSALCSYHVRRGSFIRIRRSLYRFGDFPDSDCHLIYRAWLAISLKEAVVSHESALQLFGLLEPYPSKVHLTIPRRLRRAAPPGVKLHAPVHFPPPGHLTHCKGIPVTTPARAIVDATTGEATLTSIVSAMVEGVKRGLVDRTDLLFLAQQRGVNARKLIRRALSFEPALSELHPPPPHTSP